MKATINWREAMVFDGVAEGNSVPMDAKPPIGKNSAPTPKELVALGLGGCTAMDVIALLKKYKQLPESFRVEVDATASEGKAPVVFTKAVISFVVRGQVEPGKLLEAVTLSQTKYCGVTAMLLKSFPITYRVELNGEEIGTGAAHFE